MINIESILDLDNKDKFYSKNEERKKINIGSKLSDFNVIKNLGQGHFSTVKLVTSKITDEYYAMKEIKASYCKTKDQLELIEREIKLLQGLNHPNVIKYFTSFREKQNYYIITEYLDKGSLEDLLKENKEKGKLIEEKRIWILLIQTLKGLVYLHETKKIIHRDIKPDNLLLDSKGNLKISDFGVSAVKSENVEDLLKCHGTVAGPIQFMSHEMALGDKYDFNSDIYMLGLSFFFLISNTMPERKLVLGPLYIPIPNKSAKLPLSYSEFLRNLIESFLNKEINERPSAKEALYKAINYYKNKYLKTTSISPIFSLLHCLYSISNIKNYFLGEKILKKLQEDKHNNYIITKAFKEALNSINPLDINNKKAKMNCLKLKSLLQQGGEEGIKENNEMNIFDFLQSLLIFLHEELNNVEVDIKNNENEKIDVTNKNEVILYEVKKFTTNYMSKISDQFYYLSILREECSECQNAIKYSCDINNMIEVFPDRTARHFNRKNITVMDMFRHYNKKRLYNNMNENCKFCSKKVQKVYKTKMFYSTPFNFIVEITYSDETKFNLTIDEYIYIPELVERKDYSMVKYCLVGAIFTEKKINEPMKYESITRTYNGWSYYNGDSIKNCTFEDLEKHKNLKLLFYSSN